MASATFRDFLNELESAGELKRVRARVSPVLEIAAIADHVSKSPCAVRSRFAPEFDPAHHDRGGAALLFEQVEGSDFPLAINAFGSYRRTERALGCHESGGFEAIAARIASLTRPIPPRSFRELVARAREFLPLLRTPPKRMKPGRRGPCQEVVKLAARGEVDLFRLPLIKAWPLDGDPRAVGSPIDAERSGTAAGGGRYVTFAGMHTIHADERDSERPASHNIGMYRAQLVDRTHLAMHWHVHHDGAAHWRSWKKLGRPMPIAIALGGESVLPYAATAPLPPGMSELLLAGFLNGRGIPLARAITVPLWVPANSEIVIEGFVSTECGPIGWDPAAGEPLGPGAVFEGPFGDHTGFYSLPDRYPVVEVTAITHRVGAIYPTTIVGPPPQEDYYLGKATERVFLPLLKTLVHDIVDYHLPQFGAFHDCAFVKIEKAYALQARRVMHAIWGAGQMAWTKWIVVVDGDVDVHDEAAVLRRVFETMRFDRDIEIVNGPLDILDHAAPRLGAGHKIGFDATRKLPGDDVAGVPWNATPRIAHGEAVAAQRLKDDLVGSAGIVDVAVPAIGHGRLAIVAVEKSSATLGGRAIDAALAFANEELLDFVIAVDARIPVADLERALFETCANFDPGRDVYRRGARIGIDGTTKLAGDARAGHVVRRFPPRQEIAPETAELVLRRWREYGI